EDIETPEVAKRVVDAISLAGDSEKLPTSWSKRLCKLEQLCATPQEQLDPPDWLAWARRVEEGMLEDKAMTMLHENMATWDSTAFVRQKESISELVSIINNASGVSDRVFREAAPTIYRDLMPESDDPPRHIKPLLQILITKVLFFEDPSQNELELVRDLTSTLLVMGLEEQEYASLVSDLEDLIETQMSVFRFGWSLDL